MESIIKVASASQSQSRPLLGTNESAEYKFQSPDIEREGRKGESHHGPDTRRQQGDWSQGTW